jgi:hypothetical protein
MKYCVDARRQLPARLGRDVHMHLGPSLARPFETKHQVSLGPSSIIFTLLLLLRIAVLLLHCRGERR